MCIGRLYPPWSPSRSRAAWPAGAPAVVGAEVEAGAASKRSDIRALQRKVGVAADGIFGPATERALKRWQAATGSSRVPC